MAITCNPDGCHPVQLFTVVLYNSMISVNTTLIYIPNYSDRLFNPSKDHYQALAEELYINGTVRNSTTQYNTVWYSMVKYSTVYYSIVQKSTVQCSAVQCSTVQYSIV